MDKSTNAQNKNWLIIFLIYADFTTNQELPMIDKMKVNLNNMLGEIITSPFNKKARIYVVFNSIKFRLENDDVVDKTILYTIGKEDDAPRYKIADCEIINNENCYDKGTNVLQKADQLASVFKKINEKGKNEDEEIFLNTWDHGSAFGIFRREIVTPNAREVRTAVETDSYQYPFLKLFWEFAKHKKEFKEIEAAQSKAKVYPAIQVDRTIIKTKEAIGEKKLKAEFRNKTYKQISVEKVPTKMVSANGNNAIAAVNNNETNNAIKATTGAAEILKNFELAEALQKWLKGEKVSVLLMTNCWMMNLHTMFALKDTVKYLIAPQGDIDCPGYNYKDIFKAIVKAMRDGAVFTPRNLAECCVVTCENKLARSKAVVLNRDEPGIIDIFKIFAIDLEAQTTANENCLDVFLRSLKRTIESLNKNLKSTDDSDRRNRLKFACQSLRRIAFNFCSNEISFMVDIKNFFETLSYINKNFLFDVELKDAVEDLINPELDSFYIKQSAGVDVYAASTGTITVNDPTGLSLFFPDESFDNENLIDNINTDQLLNTELKEWTEVLNRIFDLEIKLQ